MKLICPQRLSILLLSLSFISVIFISGCASDTISRYDHNAIEKSGTIYEKQELENYEAFRNDTILVPVAGIFIPVQIGSPMKDGNDFLYKVQVRDGQNIPIISKFSGFEVDECVKLFLSKTLPPRIAHGGDCE